MTQQVVYLPCQVEEDEIFAKNNFAMLGHIEGESECYVPF